jgi:hypothetical protein
MAELCTGASRTILYVRWSNIPSFDTTLTNTDCAVAACFQRLVGREEIMAKAMHLRARDPGRSLPRRIVAKRLGLVKKTHVPSSVARSCAVARQRPGLGSLRDRASEFRGLRSSFGQSNQTRTSKKNMMLQPERTDRGCQ